MNKFLGFLGFVAIHEDRYFVIGCSVTLNSTSVSRGKRDSISRRFSEAPPAFISRFHLASFASRQLAQIMQLARIDKAIDQFRVSIQANRFNAPRTRRARVECAQFFATLCIPVISICKIRKKKCARRVAVSPASRRNYAK